MSRVIDFRCLENDFASVYPDIPGNMGAYDYPKVMIYVLFWRGVKDEFDPVMDVKIAYTSKHEVYELEPKWL